MSESRPTALIAEDEPLMRERLKEKLALAWPELAVVAEANDGDEALALFDAHEPDVAFLDIRMPGRSGLDVAAAIGGECHVVFVTAFDQYAISAFDAGAVDYLLKPVSGERLAATVERLESRLAAGAPAPELAQAIATIARHLPVGRPVDGGERLTWIRASVGAQVRMIAVDEVCYFQANDKYTSVYTAEGEALIRTPLKELARALDASLFWQVHRGTIVNVAHVASTTRDLAGRTSLVLRSRPEKVAVSRAYAHRFRQM